MSPATPTTGRGPGGLRVMLYSQDGLGLGHLRRTNSIAAALVQARPDAAILTASDSRLSPFFQPTPNQDYVKLPSIVKVGPGDWRPVGLPLEFPEVHALRREMLRATALAFGPELVLVDHMPHGAMGELLPTLEALRASSPSVRIAVGLRDILDAPAVIRRVWAEEGAYEAIERHYDRVLVYGSRSVFDLAAQYDLPDAVAARVRYTGYVCTPNRARYAARLRADHGADGGRALLVAMAGGGMDGYPMMRALLDALPLVRAEQPCAAVLVTGPFMPAGQRRDLQKRAQALAATVRISVSDPLSYVEAADVVTAMAGYNSTVEILRSATPAVLVPRPGPSSEQRTRATLFAERGWVRTVDPDALDPATLAAAVLERLAEGARAA